VGDVGSGKETVDCLTKRDNENYDEYLKRCKSNPIACKVKIADLEDNMDIRRFDLLKEEDLLRAWKYLTKGDK